jgi:hypothetical protein
VFVALLLLVVAISVIDSNQTNSTRGCRQTSSTPFTANVVSDWKTDYEIENRCVDKTTLQQFSCDYSSDAHGAVASSYVQCAYSCQAGRCVAPDLAITNVEVVAAQHVGEAFDAVYTITNQGDYPTSTVDLAIYAEPGYAFLIAPPANILAPGESTEVSYRVTYQVPGTFTMTAIADPNDVVSESNEANNERESIVSVS